MKSNLFITAMATMLMFVSCNNNDEPTTKKVIADGMEMNGELHSVIEMGAEGGEIVLPLTENRAIYKQFEIVCVLPDELPFRVWGYSENPENWRYYFTIDDSYFGKSITNYTFDNCPPDYDTEIIRALHNDYISASVGGENDSRLTIKIEPTTKPRTIIFDAEAIIENYKDLNLEHNFYTASIEIRQADQNGNWQPN